MMTNLVERHSDIICNVSCVSKCSPIWIISRNQPALRKVCSTLLFWIGSFLSKKFIWKCKFCHLLTDNMTRHLLCHCHMRERLRNSVWDNLYLCCGIRNFTDFLLLSCDEQCRYLLTKCTEVYKESFANFPLTVSVVNLLCGT